MSKIKVTINIFLKRTGGNMNIEIMYFDNTYILFKYGIYESFILGPKDKNPIITDYRWLLFSKIKNIDKKIHKIINLYKFGILKIGMKI